eukprot:scaffold43105_cov664-Skeletonema_marinoi.AAC.1
MESEFDRQGERSTVYYWTVHVPTVMLHWSFTSVFSEAFLVGMDHNNNQPIIDHTRSSLSVLMDLRPCQLSGHSSINAGAV